MIKLQPGLDADFFAKLAMVDEKSLLQTLNAVAIRKDLVSMHGFLDFFESECQKGLVPELGIMGRQGETIVEPHSATSLETSNREERATLARTLMQPLHENFLKPHVPLSADEIAYTQRVADVLQQLPGEPTHLKRNTLDLVLFEACNLTRDARVFEILLEAGADAKAHIQTRAVEPTTRVNRKGDFMTFESAIHHGNYAGALAMAKREDDPENTTFAIEIAAADLKQQDKSALRGFRGNATADTMIRSLAQDDRDNNDLAQLLALMHEKVEDDARLIEVGPAFCAGLVTGYLSEVGKTSGALWDPKMLAIAAGPKGLDAEGPLACWIHDQVDQGLSGESTIACLAQEALKAHCPEVLSLCGPFLQEMARAPALAHAMEIGYLWTLHPPMRQNSQAEVPPTNPARFAATLEVLKAHGFSPQAETQSNRSDKGTALHICAQVVDVDEMLLKMPLLLAFGCDPKARDSNDEVAADLVKNSDAKARWLSIEASFRARNAAMTILDDLENDNLASAKMPQP